MPGSGHGRVETQAWLTGELPVGQPLLIVGALSGRSANGSSVEMASTHLEATWFPRLQNTRGMLCLRRRIPSACGPADIHYTLKQSSIQHRHASPQPEALKQHHAARHAYFKNHGSRVARRQRLPGLPHPAAARQVRARTPSSPPGRVQSPCRTASQTALLLAETCLSSPANRE